MYWTDFGTAKIQRANLDGSSVEDLVTGLPAPLGIALDRSAGKMYWTDAGTNKIQRANLDGSSVEDLVTTGLSLPSGIALDVTPPVKPFVFVANKDVIIDRQGASEGNIHANNDIVFKKGKPSTYKGNLTAVDDISIDSKNTIDGDATAGDEVDVVSGSTVTGTVTENASVAVEPLPSPSFTAGGSDVTVPQNGTVTLAPGVYDDVTVNKKGTLKLSSGDYFLDKLELKESAKLIIDVASGAVNINVVEKLSFDKKAAVSLTPIGDAGSPLVTFTQLDDDRVTIGESARVVGGIIAVEAEVRLSKNSRFKGAVCAEKIVVNQGTVFLPHGSSTPLPKMSEVEESEVASDQSTVISDYALEQNYPNPFNPTTTISFVLPQASEVSLSIYNTNGQLVKRLVAGEMNAGRHSLVWDATDDRGLRVASGVYLYVIKAGAFTAQRKLVLTK
jgi:cytoskeletal protein CcmA (bactofilin family)